MHEAIDESGGSYIKMIDEGNHPVGIQVNGHLPARILYFLMLFNLEQVPIFLGRHGESKYNTQNRIGGNTSLSPARRRYSQTMCDFITLQAGFRNGLNTWCSTFRTAQHFCDIRMIRHYSCFVFCFFSVIFDVCNVGFSATV